MINVYLDPSIETYIRKHIGDKQIFEISVNEFGVTVLYNKDGKLDYQELEIYWDEMR